MNKMSPVKKITISAVCVALCYVLPVAFHAFGLGTAFSPMHIPVLLCGLICGGLYGGICGILGPVLSSVLSGMPPASMLLYMVPELMVYGLVSGIGMRLIRTRCMYADLYLSLVGAMVLGRVVGGVARAILYLGGGEAFSLTVWAAGYFVGTLPGILCQLIVLPVLVITLMKVRAISVRYPKTV